jgi:toxin ParE1/3/4
MRLRLSKLAYDDLDSIYSYTLRHWGQEQADRYITQLWDSLETLAKVPERWRLREQLYPGCRVRITGKHAILYRIHEGRVEISRVLHGSMDFTRYIPPDFMGGE